MDQLLREFWAAYKRWQRMQNDTRSYGYPLPEDEERVRGRMEKIAMRIRSLEASRIPPVNYEDVPGQMFFGETVPLPKRSGSKAAGAAA